uniref:SAP domain-containing protein n=1 Tax=Anopheles christyi TaxID=43041 RepID=A0A182KEF5_9DIPT
ILDLRVRYPKLYIPSDFIVAEVGWPKSFPPSSPLPLHTGCHFHIFNKEVERPLPLEKTILDPADADYLYTVKVMLMSAPDMLEIYRNCFYRNDKERRDDTRSYLHPTRLINFLVGARGKNELMAVGGPWSPSLDGPHPDTDPKVLMRTAIRTCKALTGIDLSACSLWYRFVDIYYRRTESYHKGRLIPPRVETVVIFLPRMSACIPSESQWEKTQRNYQLQLERLLTSSNSSSSGDDTIGSSASIQEVPVPDEIAQNSSSSDEAAKLAAGVESTAGSATSEQQQEQPQQQEPTEQQSADSDAAVVVSAVVESASTDATAAAPAAAGGDEQQCGAAVDSAVSAKEGGDGNSSGTIMQQQSTASADNSGAATEPDTELLLMEYKKMKVVELKTELINRNLPTDGIKAVLLARLSEAIIEEKQTQLAKQAQQAVVVREEVAEAAATVAADTEVAIKSEPEAAADSKPPSMDVEMADVSDAPKEEIDGKANESGETKPAIAGATGGKGDPTIKQEANQQTATAGTAAAPPRKKEPQPVKLSEKERQNLERWYTMPKEPHVLVHPSRTAKSGKFECSVVSLSVLLDYRPEDTKEHSFEVALFAELFNDMLARDFGFKIYNELAKLARKASEAAAAATTAADSKKDAADGTKSSRSEAGGETSNGEDSKASIAGEKGDGAKGGGKDEKDQNDRKRRRRSVEDNHRPKPEPELARFHTVLPELLLSFVYFDITQCGYIFEKDLVELVYSLGLNLSRSQIRKTVGDVAAARNTLYYRQLTDKALDTDNKAAKKDELAEVTASLTGVDGAELTEEQSLELARGNTDYMCQLQASVLHIVNGGEQESGTVKKVKMEASDELPSTADGLVEYKGTIVDVGKCLDQAKLTERAREHAEKSLELVRNLNDELTVTNTRSSQYITELVADLKSAKKKLIDNEQTIRDMARKNSEYLSILTHVYDRVRPAVNIPDRKRSTSTVSTSHRRESSKEKSSTALAKEKESDVKDVKKVDKAGVEPDKEKREPTVAGGQGERMETEEAVEPTPPPTISKDVAGAASGASENEAEQTETPNAVAKSDQE